MTNSEQLDALGAALAVAQGEFPAISKDSTNPFFKSKYADLATVVETASPILSKNGLSVVQFPGHDGVNDTLTTWLIHKSGQYINDTMALHLAKNDPQGQGSALTYARRYSYMSVLGLVADEDDDGNAASRPKAPAAPKKAWTPPEEPAIDITENEGIKTETLGKIVNALKMKGVTAPADQTAVGTALAKGKGAETMRDLSEGQGTEILRYISDVKTTPEVLSMLKEA
jgi:hypothetical protein